MPEGYVTNNTDCYDSDPGINPETSWYQDNDGDGCGNSIVSLQQCIQPSDHVLNKIDYNDNDPDIGPPAKLDGTTPSFYLTLQDAYNAAVNGDTIQCLDVTFAEDLYIDINKSVSIKGGYGSNFSSVTGKSTLNGDLIISDGMPIVEDFILQ